MAVMDNPGDGTQTSDQVGLGAPPAMAADNGEESTPDTPFLEAGGKTFKTQEDVLNSFKEQQRKITEQANQMKLLEIEREQLRQGQILGARQKEQEAGLNAQQREDLIKRLDDEGATAYLELLEDAVYGATKQSEARIAKLEEQLQERVLGMDANYREHRAEIDALGTKFGLSKDKAIELWGEMEAVKAPQHPQRPTPPGTMHSSRVTEEPSASALSDEQLDYDERMSGIKYTREERAALKAKYRR